MKNQQGFSKTNTRNKRKCEQTTNLFFDRYCFACAHPPLPRLNPRIPYTRLLPVLLCPSPSLQLILAPTTSYQTPTQPFIWTVIPQPPAPSSQSPFLCLMTADAISQSPGTCHIRLTLGTRFQSPRLSLHLPETDTSHRLQTPLTRHQTVIS